MMTQSRMLATAITCGFVLLSLVTATNVAISAEITIGIRKDAPPFAEINRGADETLLTSYSGFAVKVCQEVIEAVALRRGHRVRVQPVTVTQRFSGLGGKGPEIDLACGPISITEERLGRFVYSFPIFLSGISYAIGQTDFKTLKRKIKLGVLWNTTVLSELSEELLSKHLGYIAKQVLADLEQLAALEGPTDPKSEQVVAEMQNVVPVGSYDEAFAKLCRGEIDYVFGDIDILSAFSEKYRRDSHCRSTISRVTLTREMYGVIFSRKFIENKDGPGLQFYLDFQKSLFALLRSKRLTELFEDTFKGKRMSGELSGFFRAYRRVNQ